MHKLDRRSGSDAKRGDRPARAISYRRLGHWRTRGTGTREVKRPNRENQRMARRHQAGMASLSSVEQRKPKFRLVDEGPKFHGVGWAWPTFWMRQGRSFNSPVSGKQLRRTLVILPRSTALRGPNATSTSKNKILNNTKFCSVALAEKIIIIIIVIRTTTELTCVVDGGAG